MSINGNALIPTERIAQSILLLRGQKVIIDADLAELYGVPTKALNQAVKRNQERFPEDFMFQLSAAEKAEVVTNCDHLANLKFAKTSPYAFTEHGAIQAANVLSSPRAVEMGVYVVRAFVRLREVLASSKELTAKLNELEHKVDSHDQAIAGLINAMRELMQPPEPQKKRSIGFVNHEEKPKKDG
ncbi:MAG: ORF6N domain-containing protein [Nitrosomonadales bacterium]|nr:ORF6N domain-containing protein [Nitrosomonadales bacterium]